jgi:hypothetical protein
MIKKFLLIACMTVSISVSAGELREVTTIREYYVDVLKKIKSGSLYQRELNLAYPVIPGVGQTASRVKIYYDMLMGANGTYSYSVIRIENYYQYTEKAYYEEYLFNQKGEPLFYYARQGSGAISRPDGISWGYNEAFYFWTGRLVRVTHGQDVNDRPGDAEIKKGADLVRQAQLLRTTYCDMYFPAPMLIKVE